MEFSNVRGFSAFCVGVAILAAPIVSAMPAEKSRSIRAELLSVQGVRVREITSSVEVAFSPDGGAEALVLRLIGSAETTIRLAGYSFTSPSIVRHLIEAKRRGVDVAIVVDSKGNSGLKSVQALNLLAHAGISTRLLDRYAIHHDKYIVVDAKHVETGSYNFTTSAATRNSENVLVIWNNSTLAARYLRHWQSRFDQGVEFRTTY
ncbi:endonuclease [Pandoraea cepalis]|uniref:phospholipase D n=1 Tax=Pandoraea cepalis TaxID=2508294 RepID=A0AAW7MGN1_9BURK|nr:phospholipase D family protein [Pandoraea cepalis]MDN4571912.1 endonuclease [Pandoraea cepalis]MDN4581366.1 endonuclease [Pandoraea cepalis]